MRQVLVVVYSYTGTSRRVAQRLAAERGWPIGEVIDAKPRTGWLRCVVDSVLRRRPAIRYAGPDPAPFDAVVLVSPIWVEGLSAPMRTFVTEHAAILREREFAVVSVMGSKGAPNAVAEISTLIGRPPMLHEAFKQRELDDDAVVARIGVFARALERAQASPRAPVLSGTLTSVAG
jgi:flavodoxin-like protein